MSEKWTISADNTHAIVTGRVAKPLSKKLNPLWWFGNDDEQNLAGAPWFMPGRAQWWRVVRWQLRNPLQNFRCYVIGVQDKNYNVVGKAPVMTVQRDDLDPPERGWQWCILSGGDLWLPRFFVSRCGVHVTWYFGWQPTGFFGMKLVPA